MKKNALTNAVIAGIAGVAGIASVANAVNLNPDGLGEVLVYPYYTVNGGNQTLLSVVNTTDLGKAVKVRFLEGRNSREVLDFNLYLSPFDVWTAAVFQLTDTGPGNLVTLDNSCTAPAIKTNTTLPQLANGNRYKPFVNFQFNTPNADSGPKTLDRTREGHFEMIEMGVVDNVGSDLNPTEFSLDAITHGASGVPDDCLQVQRAWVAGNANEYWISDEEIDILPPTGGLFGAASIVDTLNGTMLTYNADAVDGFSDVSQHTEPGSLLPNLASARTNSANNEATALVFDDGTLVTATYPLSSVGIDFNQTGSAIDAVSAVFANDAIFNEFTTTESLGAESEWVITFPTKNQYVDRPGTIAIDPFPNVFPRTGTQGTSPVDIELRVFNREEGPAAQFCDDPNNDACLPFSPRPPEQIGDTPQLLWETNVLTFNQGTVTGGSTIFGSRLTANVEANDIGVTEGWLRLGLYNATGAGSLDTHISRQSVVAPTGSIVGNFFGLPVTGYWALSVTNTAVTPGVLSNYSGLFRHRGSRSYGLAVTP